MSAPAVAVSPDGKKTALAWMDKRGGGNDANVYWTLASGLSISSDGVASDDTKGEQNHPQAAFDSTGNAVVVWEDARGGKPKIFGTSSALKGKNLEISDAPFASFPSIASGGGVIAVVYEAGNDGADRVEFNAFPAAGK